LINLKTAKTLGLMTCDVVWRQEERIGVAFD